MTVRVVVAACLVTYNLAVTALLARAPEASWGTSAGFALPTNIINAVTIALAALYKGSLLGLMPITCFYAFFALVLSFPTVQSFCVSDLAHKALTEDSSAQLATNPHTLFWLQIVNFIAGYVFAGAFLTNAWQPLTRWKAEQLGMERPQTVPISPLLAEEIARTWTAVRNALTKQQLTDLIRTKVKNSGPAAFSAATVAAASSSTSNAVRAKRSQRPRQQQQPETKQSSAPVPTSSTSTSTSTQTLTCPASQSQQQQTQQQQQQVSSDSASASAAADTCSICLDILEPGSVVSSINCNHEFHIPCLASWLFAREKKINRRTCPTCRAVIVL